MATKLVYATMVAAASAHSLYVRDTDAKVNRDSYGAPAPASYGAPAPSYSAPASSYNAPSSSYSSGGSSYSAPETGYSAPSGYGEETGGLDLTAIIIPLLALLGLSLLFPTFVSVTARRKRDADEIGEASILLGLASGHNLYRRDTGASYNAGSISSSYGGSVPSSSYDAGSASGYSGSSQGYSAPSSGYVETSGTGVTGDYGADEPYFPIAEILLPILALIGLALLFPTVTNVGVVPPGRRRKRSLSGDVEEESGPMSQVLDRVNDIYYSVVESEECMQRIACEVGGLAKDFGLGSSPVTKMIDPLVSKKYKTYYKQFTSGRNCQKIACGSFSL